MRSLRQSKLRRARFRHSEIEEKNLRGFETRVNVTSFIYRITACDTIARATFFSCFIVTGVKEYVNLE